GHAGIVGVVEPFLAAKAFMGARVGHGILSGCVGFTVSDFGIPYVDHLKSKPQFFRRRAIR
ncbi:MAG TPA: hypothetical protein PLI13_13725, partial [Paracoccus sp. (in: a-proteobacteria)]|nr:hypothetical protein [Paracoccus sp. (in: a-proteobacteria)]